MKHTIKISFLLLAIGLFAGKSIAQEAIYVKKISAFFKALIVGNWKLYFMGC